MSDFDYEVGYRRPPKAGQFKKGKSGNPYGRPKVTTDALTLDVESAMMRSVSVQHGGKRVQMSAAEARLRKMCEKALVKQDFQACKYLLELFEKLDIVKPTVVERGGVVRIPYEPTT